MGMLGRGLGMVKQDPFSSDADFYSYEYRNIFILPTNSYSYSIFATSGMVQGNKKCFWYILCDHKSLVSFLLIPKHSLRLHFATLINRVTNGASNSVDALTIKNEIYYVTVFLPKQKSKYKFSSNLWDILKYTHSKKKQLRTVTGMSWALRYYLSSSKLSSCLNCITGYSIQCKCFQLKHNSIMIIGCHFTRTQQLKLSQSCILVNFCKAPSGLNKVVTTGPSRR